MIERKYIVCVMVLPSIDHSNDDSRNMQRIAELRACTYATHTHTHSMSAFSRTITHRTLARIDFITRHIGPRRLSTQEPNDESDLHPRVRGTLATARRAHGAPCDTGSAINALPSHSDTCSITRYAFRYTVKKKVPDEPGRIILTEMQSTFGAHAAHAARC